MSVALTGADDLITSLNQSPALIAEKAGVPREALYDPEIPLRGESIGGFLHLAERRCRCRNFGLLLAERQSWSILGPVWLIIRNSETIGEALAKLEVNFSFYTTAAAIVLAQDDASTTAVCYDTSAVHLTGEIQLIELGIGILVQELKTLISSNWQPAMVQFRHQEPTDSSLHREKFGDGLAFSQDRNAIVFDADTLQMPIRRGKSVDGDVLARALRHSPHSNVVGIGIRTESVIRALLPHGQCSLSSVATALGQSKRSLQSHLSMQGTTFQSISDRVRIELAQKYLSYSDLTVGQIAELLQFSETSSLTRFFKTHHGTTPRAYRKQTLPKPEA